MKEQCFVIGFLDPEDMNICLLRRNAPSDTSVSPTIVINNRRPIATVKNVFRLVRTLNSVHIHASSLGKAIRSELPERRGEQIIETRGLEPHTPQIVNEPAEIYQELEESRDGGSAVDDEEFPDIVRSSANLTY